MIKTLKPFEEMTDADYAAIGLKVGLEIHQQLFTRKKLFCRCPAGRYTEIYDAEILRHMRPTLSELGEYDGTALMEFKTKKEIIYQINHETVCTYEMDDTPPFMLDQESLDIALEIAMLLNYQLVSELHISRKQYLDGSIPTGFQRTTIVGVEGWIPYKDRKIGLIQLGLEEDACREVSDVGHLRIYRTDRLGMPLIEMVTQADMHTPAEVADVANILRWTVRSTGKVRTGIGAARQDVNVSVTGGTRVEIKGVSRIPYLPRLIYNEARRQYSLLQIRQELHRRRITEKTFQSSSANVTNLLSRTSWEPLQQALQRQEEIHCVNLKGFAGILSQSTQTDKVFSKEISDRVRVVACLSRLPNITTSESTEETIDSFTWQKIRKHLSAGPEDALVLVWGNKEDVRTGANEISIRAREATIGIPSETRQALIDGTNGFERILPGPDRMYPDTDLPPLEITDQHLNRIRELVPDPFWNRLEKYREWGVPEHLLIAIASSPKAIYFEQLVKRYKIPAVQIARYLFEKTTAWKRAGQPVSKFTENIWDEFFAAADKFSTLLENGDKIITDFLQGDKGSILPLPESHHEIKSDKRKTDRLVKEIIKQICQEKLPAFTTIEKKHHYLMRKIMETLRGRTPGKLVSRLLWEHLKGEINER
ncbi:MAG: glutamyl-tRNA(Gln) amidotransferase subunit E [Caldithrix sp. RBG_13_44_9]|nr:MAG: glutamyl-tRNA(Gln) amidotransferase subunit E [Caldithrix sp. RBG_13_44_9]